MFTCVVVLQENPPTPSPLALLAATCSRIGADEYVVMNAGAGGGMSAGGGAGQGGGAGCTVPGGGAGAGQLRLVKGEDGAPPQLITLSHLHNFLPLAAAAAAAQQQQGGQGPGGGPSPAEQQQQQQVQSSAAAAVQHAAAQGKLVQAQAGAQVVSVGLPQQFLQVISRYQPFLLLPMLCPILISV